MAKRIKEPNNRPRERIERLLDVTSKSRNRRASERMPVEPGTMVFIPMVCRGEVVDVSDEGISVRFKPVDAIGLKEGETLRISMPLGQHQFVIPSTVRHVESRFGVIVLGMSFNPDEIEMKE